MRLRKKVITAKWLKEQDACEPAIKWFHTKFGERAAVQDVAKALLRSRRCASGRDEWNDWFLRELLSDHEQREHLVAWLDAPFGEEGPVDLAWLRKIANS